MQKHKDAQIKSFKVQISRKIKDNLNYWHIVRGKIMAILFLIGILEPLSKVEPFGNGFVVVYNCDQ